MSADMNDYEKSAQEMEVKFGFYSVALTFTILGLSIQTASFGANFVADSAELLAWLILLISGFNGLSRLEHISHLLELFSEWIKHSDNDDMVANIDKQRDLVLLESLRHRSAFKWGLGLLVVSRGLVPGLDLFRANLGHEALRPVRRRTARHPPPRRRSSGMSTHSDGDLRPPVDPMAVCTFRAHLASRSLTMR